MAEIREAAACARFSLRGPAALLGPACGLDLPLAPLTSTAAGDRHALWLGPEEWLLLAAPGWQPAPVAGASVVEISHGLAGVELHGAAAETLLNEACPLDLALAAFPPGACTRTLFGKVEIVLWRRAANAWRLELGRSFLPHLLAHLREAAADLD